jgi:hypothetical protein
MEILETKKRKYINTNDMTINTNDMTINDMINTACEISKRKQKSYINDINEFKNNIKLIKSKCLNYMNSNNCQYKMCKFTHLSLKPNECINMNNCTNNECTKSHYPYKYNYCFYNLSNFYCDHNNCNCYHVSNDIIKWIKDNNICVNMCIHKYCRIKKCKKNHNIK